jgi:capsular polysaccharide transport system permease protein
LSHVSVIRNSSSGIAQLRVTAFRNTDAKEIATNLLAQAEELVNRMNARAQSDALSYAQDELKSAEARVVSAQGDLTAFRNRALLIDPSTNSTKMLDVIGGLASELAEAQAQLHETIASAPSSPVIDGIKARIAALENQIASERDKLAGGDDTLATKMAGYERLVLDREFADRGFMLASSELEFARQEARRQQIYIETVVAPNIPDESREPRRFRNTATVFAVTFAIFVIFWFMSVAAKEHLHA